MRSDERVHDQLPLHVTEVHPEQVGDRRSEPRDLTFVGHLAWRVQDGRTSLTRRQALLGWLFKVLYAPRSAPARRLHRRGVTYNADLDVLTHGDRVTNHTFPSTVSGDGGQEDRGWT